ncbi:peptidase inhibitor family I36 protein [Micromonospora matsumotoense]|uniref:peptidase inhibitor family I36 protein n=1 Tax=Micromonospora matsumotoense TaxID=121616 RepID=UPI0034099A85
MAVTLAAASPGMAAPGGARAPEPTTDGVVAKILAEHPDAVRANRHDVVFPDGTRVSVHLDAPAVGEARVSGQYDCLYGALCLFPNKDFGGKYIGWDTGAANTCRDFDLTRWSASNWASSIVNNRPSGTVSTFWDNTNSTGLIGYQHAYGFRQNLAFDTASIGGTWDNRISSMRVC